MCLRRTSSSCRLWASAWPEPAKTARRPRSNTNSAKSVSAGSTCWTSSLLGGCTRLTRTGGECRLIVEFEWVLWRWRGKLSGNSKKLRRYKFKYYLYRLLKCFGNMVQTNQLTNQTSAVWTQGQGVTFKKCINMCTRTTRWMKRVTILHPTHPQCITPSGEGFILVWACLSLGLLPWYPSWLSCSRDGEFIFPQCCWGISWVPCWCQWGLHLVELQTKQREVTFLIPPRPSSFVSVHLFGTLDTSAHQSWNQFCVDFKMHFEIGVELLVT